MTYYVSSGTLNLTKPNQTWVFQLRGAIERQCNKCPYLCLYQDHSQRLVRVHYTQTPALCLIFLCPCMCFVLTRASLCVVGLVYVFFKVFCVFVVVSLVVITSAFICLARLVSKTNHYMPRDAKVLLTCVIRRNVEETSPLF